MNTATIRSGKEHSTLAIRGARPHIGEVPDELFHWPIITADDEAAVLAVLRRGDMSGTSITKQFEAEFASWIGAPYALATCNGTAALQAAMWACDVGAGDEIICPGMTYWASALPALLLGATVNFADIDRETLCINPADIEHRIGERTRAIVVVHYAGHPCNMDAITDIARRHSLRVIEDVSHAHGSRYRGTMTGTIGDIAAMSMMAGKSFPVGEGGMIVTADRLLYERCIAFGHYERTGVRSNFNPVDSQVKDPSLAAFAGAPLGGVKHRMNQLCSALGRSQLRVYDERIAEIQDAMHYFWDLLSDVPGFSAHRVERGTGSTMGGWYYPQGLFNSSELDGLSSADFCAAVRAEGVAACAPGGNAPLHLHPVFHDADIFHMGAPTAVSFGQRDVRQGPGTLPVTEAVRSFAISIPWFKRMRKPEITRFAEAFRKVCEHAEEVPRAQDSP